MDEKRSFWLTLPGILTGVAAVLTALTGLVVALVQNGIIGGRTPAPNPPTPTVQIAAAPTPTVTSPTPLLAGAGLDQSQSAATASSGSAEAARGRLTAGQAALASGSYQQAFDQCGAAIGLDPTSWDAYWCRGVASDHLGNNEAAISDYSAVIRLNPQFERAYLERGLLTINALGQCSAEARADLRRYLQAGNSASADDAQLALQKCGG